MECPAFCRYSFLDFACTVVGVCTYLFDLGSDLWVAAEFYVRDDLVWFGLVVGFVLLSSTVVQAFSWFWFKYDRELEEFKSQTSAEKILLGGEGLKLNLLHALQLGFLMRHVSAIEQGFRVWRGGRRATAYAAYVTHDLSMLRLLEAFCESAPQLALLLYIILHTGHARPVQCVSVLASSVSIAGTVAMYHRSLRSFLPDKAGQSWASTALYFLWNLLLIAPRLVAVALFASALPRLAAVHFLCLWPPLLLWAWLQRTCLMDSAGGEWLYRGAVALIWYFSWFNVAEGRSRWRGLIYHALMVTDGGILLGTWWWLEGAEFKRASALGVVVSLPSAYFLGLLLKGLYYCYLHPKLRPLAVGEGDPTFRHLAVGERDPEPRSFSMEEGDPKPRPFSVGEEEDVPDTDGPSKPLPPQLRPPSQLCNKRMAGLAKIFYTPMPVLPYACLSVGNTTNGIV